MKTTIALRGLQEVERTLKEIAPKHAKNIIRATVGGVAGEVRDRVKAELPVEHGDLRKSVKVKRRRGAPGFVRADVVVTKKTGYYWRFLEYGTSSGIPAGGYFLRTITAIRGDLPKILNAQFVKKFEAALARQKKKLLK